MYKLTNHQIREEQQVRCPFCGVYQNHVGNCPTQLATRDQRVSQAAHLFRCFTGRRGQVGEDV